ncbi:MAG: hypothetical protein M1818_005173 [Claussenomyces sp. TS43310]|nr:MAG: hypothetical protein M1818_005173 [Claussenomyces sp. TS43310]
MSTLVRLEATELEPWRVHYGDELRSSVKRDLHDGVYKDVDFNIARKKSKTWGLRRLTMSARVSSVIEEVDLIVCFEGAEVGMIIRPTDNTGCYTFLGPALIRGRKRFDAIARKASLQEFTLV